MADNAEPVDLQQHPSGMRGFFFFFFVLRESREKGGVIVVLPLRVILML